MPSENEVKRGEVYVIYKDKDGNEQCVRQDKISEIRHDIVCEIDKQERTIVRDHEIILPIKSDFEFRCYILIKKPAMRRLKKVLHELRVKKKRLRVWQRKLERKYGIQS